MRTRNWLAIAVMGISVAAVLPAHHSFTAEFDEKKPVKLVGKVTEMKWSNPHSWIYIDVETNGKKVNWALETGAAIFVDVARIYSLAHGLAQTNSRQRLEAAGQHMALAENEYGAWVSGFEFLQMLRLRIQLKGGPALAQPNRLVVAQLNDIDRRILRETLRVARQLQQRLQLDYQR